MNREPTGERTNPEPVDSFLFSLSFHVLRCWSERSETGCRGSNPRLSIATSSFGGFLSLFSFLAFGQADRNGMQRFESSSAYSPERGLY